MKKQIIQAVHLIKQNPFYSLISIVGTAITIAFVMVVIMMYKFRSADIAPESDRSRLMYTATGRNSKKDGSNIYSGMGKTAFEALFLHLPGVEEITWYTPLTKALCSLPASSERYNYQMKQVAANWFNFFEYDFIAGRPFTQAEYDMGRSAFRPADSEFKNWEAVENANYRHVVISERVARQLFGSAHEAIDKNILVNFLPATVVGVIRDVSSIFQTAYADILQPFTLVNEENEYRYKQTGGLHGKRMGVMKLAEETDPESVRQEVERREELLNNQQTAFQFDMQRLYTHTEYTFFKDSHLDARLIYVLLILVLLGVPAISISGLMNAQMQGRYSEIAIRKAYGASNHSIINRLFAESLINTLLGGILGFILSCILVWLGRIWLFGMNGTELSGIFIDTELLFRPDLFGAVLLVCLVFNLLSVLLPAGLAVRKNIVTTLKGGE